MAEPPVRAVFFDVGGTIARPRSPIARLVIGAARAARLPIGTEEAAQIASRLEARLAARPRQGEAFTYPPERSRQRWLEIYRASLDGISPPVTAERIAEVVWRELSSPAGYARYPDVLPALRQLADAGLALGVISNWEAWLPALLEHLDVARFFSCVVVSGQHGAEKPDAALFVAALDATNIQPYEAVHVGDSATDDVQGAMQAGMSAVLLDRSRSGVPAASVPIIDTLTALPALVAAWRRGPDRQAVARSSASVGARGRSTR